MTRDLDVSTLRELLRNLVSWRAVYETDGVEVLVAPSGTSWCLWDIEYLYDQIHLLPPRQRQAIELCLIRNIKEKEAAVIMGVSETNPVMMYASLGLAKIVAMVESGSLPRFRREEACA